MSRITAMPHALDPITEERVDLTEQIIRQKLENASGFADPLNMSRWLDKQFRFFSSEDDGFVNFDEFVLTMVRLNFVGDVQRDMRALFDRHDELGVGRIDYKEFSRQIFGIGATPYIVGGDRHVAVQVRAAIAEALGAAGLRVLSNMLPAKVNQEELISGLAVAGIHVSESDCHKLMRNFRRKDAYGRYPLEEFILAVRGCMGRSRMDRVRVCFETMGGMAQEGEGLDLTVVLRHLDASMHPDVRTGRMREQDATDQIIESLTGGQQVLDGCVVDWIDFLQLHQDLSAGLPSDSEFNRCCLMWTESP